MTNRGCAQGYTVNRLRVPRLLAIAAKQFQVRGPACARDQPLGLPLYSARSAIRSESGPDL
jgi:hypothetical protein